MTRLVDILISLYFNKYFEKGNKPLEKLIYRLMRINKKFYKC